MEKTMAETTDATGAAPAPIAAVAGAPPPPAAPPNLYDPGRNRQYGVTTLEDVWAEFSGNQDALAARVRQDKVRRHQKTWDDAVERASDGVRMKALKETLKGTKRSTETMIHMTGCSAPTSQMSISMGENFPWAAPRLRIMAAQSQIETESGTGVAPFVMPSDRVIIQMGKEEAKKAGAWGVLQTLLINAARATVDVVDLPKNVGWKNGRGAPYPWWKDEGPLAPPWHEFHLYTEVLDPDQHLDPQPAWTLDLYVRDGVPVMMRGRAFVVRSKNNILASAADALDQFMPHVTFIAAHKVGDATGKQHATFDEIAGALIMAPGALVERLRGEGFLNLRGEATPAALDAGITTIADGGSQFCLDAIKNLVGTPTAGGSERREADETADAAPTDEVAGEPDAPKADTDQAEELAEVATTGESGSWDTPTVEVDQAEELEDATDAVAQVTVWRGGGMRQVTAQPKDRSDTDDEMDELGPEPLRDSRSVDDIALARRATEQLEGAMEALLSAQNEMCRSTEDGVLVPHPGANETLRSRIKVGAEAVARVHAVLSNAIPLYRTLLERDSSLAMKAQRLETENAELKRSVLDGLAKIAELEGGLAGYAEVIPLPASSNIGDHSAAAASH
jgi:hypothetical protein